MSGLLPAEQEAATRARALLERTHYDATGEQPERVHDARNAAQAALDLTAALAAERAARRALQARCGRLQELLGARAYQACETAAESRG